MALKPDQRAMLQLMLERDQSYDDIASVLGGERDDVRERARAALAELGGSDPDSDVDLTDYLLGQADPIGRADAVRHLQSDPETLGLAEKITAQLQLLAPDAELPQLPRSKGGRSSSPAVNGDGADKPFAPTPRRASRGDGADSVATRLRTRFDEHRRQSLIILGALALALVIALLFITGVLGGGDDEPASSEPAATRQGYPLSPIVVKEGKEFKQRFPIPPASLPIAAGASTISVSLSDNATLGPRLTEAVSAGQPVLDYTDDSVLTGEVPESDNAQPDAQGELITVDLEGVGDSTASGEAVIGVEDQEAFLDVGIDGLEPAPTDRTYVLWFLLPEGTDLGATTAPPQPGGAVPQPGGAVPQPGGAVPQPGGAVPQPGAGGGDAAPQP